MKKVFLIKTLVELDEIAKILSKNLKSGTLVLLNGELGSGKTALVKKLLGHIGIDERKVKSPTFSLINRHICNGKNYYHIDLYRIINHDRFILEEIKELVLHPNSIVLIEWAENQNLRDIKRKAQKLIEINIEHVSDNRKISIKM